MKRTARTTKTEQQIAKWIVALEQIAELATRHEGDRGEEEWNDMESAYNNGVDVGEYEALVRVGAIARNALK